jgi:Uma2 family endonuclease
MTIAATKKKPAKRRTARSENVLPSDWTLEDVRQYVGGVPRHRIRLDPRPGTATEADVIWLDDHADCLCELVDGILVEKAVGYRESLLASYLSHLLISYLDKKPLGFVMGEAGMVRTQPRHVRMPDVSVVLWDRFPDRKLPDVPVLHFSPELAIEILSRSNTSREIRLKLKEYFSSGTVLAWVIDPRSRTADVYSAPDHCEHLSADGILRGGSVLPGFRLHLQDLFDRLPT